MRPRKRRMMGVTPRQTVSLGVMKACAWSGFVILTVSLATLLVGYFMMAQSVDRLHFEDSGDVQAVVESLSKTTTALEAATNVVWLGLGIMLVGVTLISVVLVKHRYRARWFFWTVLVTAIALLLFPWIGTIAGLGWLIYLFFYRDEFPIGNVQMVQMLSEERPLNKMSNSFKGAGDL